MIKRTLGSALLSFFSLGNYFDYCGERMWVPDSILRFRHLLRFLNLEAANSLTIPHTNAFVSEHAKAFKKLCNSRSFALLLIWVTFFIIRQHDKKIFARSCSCCIRDGVILCGRRFKITCSLEILYLSKVPCSKDPMESFHL